VIFALSTAGRQSACTETTTFAGKATFVRLQLIFVPNIVLMAIESNQPFPQPGTSYEMPKKYEKLAAFMFGVVFVVVLLYLAVNFPAPSNFQYLVFRVILALASAGVASMVPGFLEVQISNWLRATGALAVFVIVYFFSPASLVVTAPSQVGILRPSRILVHEGKPENNVRLQIGTSAVLNDLGPLKPIIEELWGRDQLNINVVNEKLPAGWPVAFDYLRSLTANDRLPDSAPRLSRSAHADGALG
jgi:hypothetical protein